MKRFALSLLALSACTTNVPIGAQPSADAGADSQSSGEPLAQHSGNIDKVDLLFVVDNSISMADKQVALSKRIPELVRLLTQIGVSPITGGVPKITDLHVATITTSLGSLGTSACDPAMSAANDDRGHLLPRDDKMGPTKGWAYKTGSTEPVEVSCPKIAPGTSVEWVLDPATNPSAQFKGESKLPDLEAAVTCTVLGARTSGCGYEMPLESMYRFLVDPTPPRAVGATCSGDFCTGTVTAAGVDDELLAQRHAFLRPDSLLAIVLITDENDTSVRAEGENWRLLANAAGKMERGSASCALVPDDVSSIDPARLFADYGCKPCATSSMAGCSWPNGLDVDARNIRAFEHIQRFGYDYLYPLQRYVDGLTRGTVVGRDGSVVANPIFAGGRARDMVVLAGIVGAPSALVNDATGYPRELGEGDWKKLISPVLTERDPHMIESIEIRAGVPPYAGDPAIDPINGGDRHIGDGNDLQYACLGAPSTEEAEVVSDCLTPALAAGNPACHDEGIVRLKAYPSLRPLRVIRGVGQSGYVASICDATYRGAIAGIAKKIGESCIGK